MHVAVVSRQAEAPWARPTFEQVYASERAAVGRSVRRLGVPAHGVDDVVQQVFVAVYRRLDQFDGRCSLSTWLFAIVARVVSNHRRAYRRKGMGQALATEVGSVEELVARGCSPFDYAQTRQAARIAHDVLSQMPATKARTFFMFEVAGYTAPEIARETSVPLNTVYSRLRNARVEFARLAAQRTLRDRTS
jgi:RNA polymerase sigma-70 factor (ECF subfamily)